MYDGVTAIKFDEVGIHVGRLQSFLASGEASIDSDGAVVALRLDGWADDGKPAAQSFDVVSRDVGRFEDTLIRVFAAEVAHQYRDQIQDAVAAWREAVRDGGREAAE